MRPREAASRRVAGVLRESLLTATAEWAGFGGFSPLSTSSFLISDFSLFYATKNLASTLDSEGDIEKTLGEETVCPFGMSHPTLRHSAHPTESLNSTLQSRWSLLVTLSSLSFVTLPRSPTPCPQLWLLLLLLAQFSN